MKIRTFNKIDNDVFQVIKHTEDFSEGDMDLMIKFGEPEIDLGGTFTANPDFTLPNNLAKLKSESPFTQNFDSRDIDAAQAITIAIQASGDAATLNGLYFDIDSADGGQYRVWFDENNTGVPPAAAGRTLVEVDLPAAGTTTDTANNLQAALDGLLSFSAEVNTLDVLVLDATSGQVTDPDQGTTTTAMLTLTVTTQGDSAETRADLWSVEINARIKAALAELRANTDGFTSEEVENC
jgi:hypothetical protein